MKLPSLILPLIAAGAAVLLSADQSQGAADADAKTGALIREVQAQQKTLVENHARIDEKLAAVAEELRLARIFVSRGGK